MAAQGAALQSHNNELVKCKRANFQFSMCLWQAAKVFDWHATVSGCCVLKANLFICISPMGVGLLWTV